MDGSDRKAFWQGFWSVWLYMGAFACLAPLWMRDWERPMKRMLTPSAPTPSSDRSGKPKPSDPCHGSNPNSR